MHRVGLFETLQNWTKFKIPKRNNWWLRGDEPSDEFNSEISSFERKSLRIDEDFGKRSVEIFSECHAHLENKKTRNFHCVSSQSGSILVNDTSIAENKYCLEFSEKNENETENPWLLVVCDDNSKLYEQLHVICRVIRHSYFDSI